MATEAQINMRKAVYEYFSLHPEKHQQAIVIGRDNEDINTTKDAEKFINSCNTNMCIAGATILFDAIESGRKSVSNNNWLERATNLLGLSKEEATDLFLGFNNQQALNKLKEYAYGDN